MQHLLVKIKKHAQKVLQGGDEVSPVASPAPTSSECIPTLMYVKDKNGSLETSVECKPRDDPEGDGLQMDTKHLLPPLPATHSMYSQML